MLKFHIISLGILLLTYVNAHPEFMLANAKFRSQLYCHVPMKPGLSVMGMPLIEGKDASVKLTQGKDELIVNFVSTTPYEYFMEVKGAKFLEGGCNSSRSTEDGGEIVTNGLSAGATINVTGYYSQCSPPLPCQAYYTPTVSYVWGTN